MVCASAKMAEGIGTIEEISASFFMTEGPETKCRRVQLSHFNTDSEGIDRLFNGCERLHVKQNCWLKILTDPQQI
jgi:hypothetical protein